MKRLLTQFIAPGLVLSMILSFGLLIPTIGFAATNSVPVTTNITGVDDCTNKDCYQTFKGLEQALQKQEKALGMQFDSFGQAQDLTGFINALIGFAIGIAGVLAVVMIMYEGYLYMSTDNVTTKSSARSRIVNTVAGFVLLLCMYTLLRTINPDLLILMPHLEGVTLDVGTAGDTNEALETAIEKSPEVAKIYATSKGHWRDAGSLTPKTEAARKTKADSIPVSELYNLQTNGLTLKSGVNKFIHNSVGPKLKNLDTALKAQGIKLIVTEAFKPTTYKHYAACHYTATCIDGDITFDAVDVATLISEAQKAGLVAVWETKNQADYTKLINLGVPKSNVILFKGHITGDHASIYDYQ